MGHQLTGNWGATSFKQPYRSHTKGVSLCDTFETFPSKLKQAMFAAASTRVIKRGTWNGCAFNAAGVEVDETISNTTKAALTFGVTKAAVQQFIRIWDRMPGTDEECTATLRTCIEKAGLFTEPGQRPPRIIKIKVYEDQQKKLREQFDDLMTANMIDGTDLMESIMCGAV